MNPIIREKMSLCVFVQRLHWGAFFRGRPELSLPVPARLRLVPYWMQRENKPRILRACTAAHQPPTSAAGVCVDGEKVPMFAEVKVICQSGETAGWLGEGNW